MKKLFCIGVFCLFLTSCIGNTVGWKNSKKIGVAEDFGKDNKAKFGVVEKGVNTITDGVERLESIGD